MKRRGKLALAQSVFACLVVLFASYNVYAGSLQDEFDRLCVHTQDAESLPLEQLQELVAECDQLKQKIEQSDDAKKKLLLFRLEKCRNFLEYIVELRQEDNSGSQQ